MDESIRSLAFGAALLAVSPARAIAAESPVPVEVFARDEVMSAPALSPDGKHLVYISSR